MLPPTQRFSSRVADYVRYRPSYPPEVVQLLQQECGLGPSSAVADVGSGTGISTGLLLRTGATVFGIEPNAGMRQAAEASLSGNPSFHSVEATAEATTLPDGSVDLITAFQSFHWFDHAAVPAEFRRIGKPGANLALVWNERSGEGTPFLDGFEALLQEHAREYKMVGHRKFSPSDLEPFFGGGMRVARFSNAQSFDFDGLRGRLLSSSYAPERGDPQHEPMMAALRGLFERTQVAGKVEFRYDTQVYYGPL